MSSVNYVILFVHIPVMFLSNLALNILFNVRLKSRDNPVKKKISAPSSIEELNTITLAISTCRAIIGKRLDANVQFRKHVIGAQGTNSEDTSLLQIEVFIEAATTWGDIRRTASTKLALCSSCTRGRFHRRDQVSFFTRARENTESLVYKRAMQKDNGLYTLYDYFKYQCFLPPKFTDIADTLSPPRPAPRG